MVMQACSSMYTGPMCVQAVCRAVTWQSPCACFGGALFLKQIELTRSWTTSITALTQAMHKRQAGYLQPPCACSSGASPGQHPPWPSASDPLHSTSAMCSASVTCATVKPPLLCHLKQGRLMASR